MGGSQLHGSVLLYVGLPADKTVRVRQPTAIGADVNLSVLPGSGIVPCQWTVNSLDESQL